MDINNNQQINTFTKGMDTDTSDMYIGEGSYRYAENLRVVTDKDGNTGELHVIEGTSLAMGSKANGVLLLGFTSIRNYIIEIIKRGNTWAIYRTDITSDDPELKRVAVTGGMSEPIWPEDWDGRKKVLSLVTRWESAENIKLYIANGKTDLLSINIAPGHEATGKNFEQTFQTTKLILEPIKATITDRDGASIPGVTLQYAYIIYNINGEASTMSILSDVVTQAKDKTHGYAVDENGTKIVELQLPADAAGKYLKIYRVAYPKAGQMPRVDVIYNQECQSLTVYDSGQSLENVATAEFVATNKLLFVPKEIESKGDYLFAANVEYTQDTIDKQFENFDARCYSTGNYYVQDNVPHNIDISSSASFDIPKNADLRHSQFGEGIGIDYNPDCWEEVDGANGRGKCFEWKYIFDSHTLYFSDQYKYEDSLITPRTYARNEVYRFGVRLFDKNGNASSIKWMADIKMPNYFSYTTDVEDDYISIQPSESATTTEERALNVNTILIKFTPRNTNSDYWENVERYEIVQAKRSIVDSYKICQGIVGYPMEIVPNELCLPYFLTMQDFIVKRGFFDSLSAKYRAIKLGNNNFPESITYSQYKKALIYASPEYTYQPDDIQQIIKQYKSNLSYKLIGSWVRYAEVVERENDAFNQLETDSSDDIQMTPRHVLKYRTAEKIGEAKNTTLCPDGTDLRVQLCMNANNTKHLGEYCISNQTITSDTDTVATVELLNKSGSKNPTKKVFFTNMYPQKTSYKSKKAAISINNVTFTDVQSLDDFAKDQHAQYKNQFKTLHDGKKFFNWTNPAMLHDERYHLFTIGGDDTEDSFDITTMSAYDSKYIEQKDTWKVGIDVGNDYTDQRAIIGSLGLAFPMSPGGASMILEFNNEIPQYNNGYFYDSLNSTASMPAISVANIYKHATPYGGYNRAAIDSTSYISCGAISDKSKAVNMSFGDNYITMFAYCPYHALENAVHNSVHTAGMQYIVPIESTIDLTKQCSNWVQAFNSSTLPIDGDKSGRWVQAKPTTLSGRFTQTEDMYMYNTAYSVLPDVVTYAGQDTVNVTSPIYDSRIHYSLKKDNNELIDSWTNFKTIDYLDVDSRYGQITGLKLFKDKLVFLQENGAGVVAVNDRTIIKDSSSANIILGSGGVLDRYDYFTTVYGMKPNQHVAEVTNDALYWWDGHRREILGYTDGYNVALLQRIKNVQNYINTGDESDMPSIVCDASNKEVLFNVVNNRSLVYNEQTQQFTSVYTFSPIYYCNINGRIFLTEEWSNRADLYEYNVYDQEGPRLITTPITPKLKYIVNKDSIYNKVFDTQTFGGRFYGGSLGEQHDNTPLHVLNFNYYTPLKQHSHTNGSKVTNIEYDYRLAIPRNNNDSYGGRMRGKTMECEISSTSNDPDFSIQYVITKYRMSWT